MMTDPNRNPHREENEFHLRVALYHLRKIRPDYVTPSGINEWTATLRHAELLLAQSTAPRD